MNYTGDVGCDRDNHRQYNSGPAQRKAKEEERAARESEDLCLVPKIIQLIFSIYELLFE